jgi:hypothetical protein
MTKTIEVEIIDKADREYVRDDRGRFGSGSGGGSVAAAIHAADQQRIEIVADRILSASAVKEEGIYEVFVADVKSGLEDAYRAGAGDMEVTPTPGALEKIASEHLGMASLDTRRRDSLDFKVVADVKVKDAVAAAYEAGDKRRIPAQRR